MGFDQPKQSSSSGIVIVIVAVVLFVAILGIVAVAGAGLFLVGTTSQQSRAIAIEQRMLAEEQRAIVELHQAEAETQQTRTRIRISDGVVQIQRPRVAVTPDPRLNLEVNVDQEGNTSIGGEGIGLDELMARLAKLKDETSNAFSVRINTEPECPVKLLIPVLDACHEVGDVDLRVATSRDSESPSAESTSGN